MKRLVVLTSVLMLVLAGCHQAASPPVENKDPETTAQDDSNAKTPVSFSTQKGRRITSDEVPLLEQINRENTKVMAAVTPGVVRITAARVVDPRLKSGNNFPFQFHFGQSTTHNMQETDPSYGAGVILSKDGYIVTNTHVIEDAREIDVELHDKRSFPARIVAFDASLDIAVLKIDATGLTVISWGNSDHVQVGEQIFAVGNPFNQEGSVSKGIVSATARSLPDSPNDESYIQTDAAINPGNSGGPLVNIHGELIGLNTLIASTSGGNEGVGFAIPSNLVSHAVEGLLKESSTAHGYLGVKFPESIDDGVKALLHLGVHGGALLAGVYPGTPAEKAGLHTGDFITEMDGHKIHGSVDLRLVVAQIPIGKEVTVSYIRDGAPQSTTVTIAQAPADFLAGMPDTTPASNPASPPIGNALTGLQVSDLNSKSRQQFSLDQTVTSGVVATMVEYSSPADMKSIMRGDVIESISINHGSTHQLATAKDFADVANSLKPDEGVVLLVHHGKSSSFIYLTPAN
jgi:serine protease Do